ncbi:unnamed protein product [Acanthosepion pharaonis]|uniref:Uncharacterized protein n=1 Tax=Acanthosepion pharaonis TaxID=158019 RepID=A0A812CWF9_ACAPH|nr:unnamed protein product [Sepia pharaonis]
MQRPDDTPAKETDLEKAVADLQHQLQDIRMLLSANREARCRRPAVGDGEHGVPAGIDESTRNYAGTITDSAPGQGIARHPANTAPKPSRKKLNSRRVGAAEPRQKHTKPPFLRMGPTEPHKVFSGHRSSNQCDTPPKNSKTERRPRISSRQQTARRSRHMEPRH